MYNPYKNTYFINSVGDYHTVKNIAYKDDIQFVRGVFDNLGNLNNRRYFYNKTSLNDKCFIVIKPHRNDLIIRHKATQKTYLLESEDYYGFIDKETIEGYELVDNTPLVVDYGSRSEYEIYDDYIY